MVEDFVEQVVAWVSDADTLWFLGFWAVLALLAGVEIAIPAFQQPPQREKRWPTNLGLGIINMMLAPLLPVSEVLAAQWAQNNQFGLLNKISAPLWVAMIATFVIRDFANYALHVLLHKAPLFWRLHRVHHFDMHVDVSTSLRHHPVEYGVALVAMTAVAILFGFDPRALAAYAIAVGVSDAYSHANLRLPKLLDEALRWLLVTPNMHCLHHSSYQRETDSNYGQIFSVWDRLFGTYSAAPRAGYDAMQIGLEEIRDARTSDLWWQVKSPLLSIERRGITASTDKAVPAE